MADCPHRHIDRLPDKLGLMSDTATVLEWELRCAACLKVLASNVPTGEIEGWLTDRGLVPAIMDET